MLTKKTPYEWCIEREIKIIGLINLPNIERVFYTEYFSEDEVTAFIDSLIMYDDITIEHGKLHLKSDKYLELRMYSLVPYNLLGIQMGIQHEHSTTSYVNDFLTSGQINDKYVRWAKEWKTSILLNGGTSNEGHNVRHGFKDVWYVGTMQQHLDNLIKNNITVSTFYEPDLNSMLTAISFIVDERVFNRSLYKDYIKYESDVELCSIDEEWEREYDRLNTQKYENWVEDIGGPENVFLRNFLRNFSLARG